MLYDDRLGPALVDRAMVASLPHWAFKILTALGRSDHDLLSFPSTLLDLATYSCMLLPRIFSPAHDLDTHHNLCDTLAIVFSLLDCN